ncbi:putative zinc finger protein [Trypanosoma theileri]|uniref:Putative zinc finger protein n=1 Tax=Trypanosoma theileri TaxID=67003 RepID=A0A1X0NT87_9TRYP|nr:putative zinc finger protein [Trypanosoma theileri]ORC87683.1 putative zinc finger protein [Trypanosoma theileri]
MLTRRSVLGEWKSDRVILACQKCEVTFTFSCRRHHCRYCGGIFCASCSNIFVQLPQLQTKKPQRICCTCYSLLSKPVLNELSKTEKQLEKNTESLEENFHGISDEASHLTYSTEIVANSTKSVIVESGNKEEAYFNDYCDVDTSSSSDDVSAAIAGVYSSVDDGKRTTSISFIASLQDNLRNSEDADVVNVLLFVSATRYQVICVTVAEGESMMMLVRRLVDSYFRLEKGPFKSFTDVDRDILLEKLKFFTETIVIDDNADAIDVLSQYNHLVLSTLSPLEMMKARDEVPIRYFFCTEHHGDSSLEGMEQ